MGCGICKEADPTPAPAAVDKPPPTTMSKKYKVYVTRKVPRPGIEFLEKDCQLTFWDSDEAIPREELIKNIKGSEALFCMLTDIIDGDILDAAGAQLKIVSTMSVGYEHIDLEACKKRNIQVTNTPNVSTDSVAELTVSLLLLTCRRLPEGIVAVKGGEWGLWKPMWICGTEITNKVVGIYGLGRIGQGVGRRLNGFGASKLIYNDVVEVSQAKDINAQYVTFDELLTQADFICICCNLTKDNKHKFNKEAFEKMKKSAIMVNTGRGGVINHDDLYDALVAREITAAGLDVTEPEPLPASHKLVSLGNCVVLPHMGSNTWESRNLMSLTAAQNIMGLFKGTEIIGKVNMG